ncbi:MAG TPA: biotin-dependent carboxyltransferase family protein [Actinoplanes sp.]|nr:biotin-dependent carboxyltransferase family protein [Actinoplanes sp.]
MTSAGTVLVLRSGLVSTVQDLGRPGFAHLGVPRSGAADSASLTLANRLIGNPPDAAGIETTVLGIDVRFSDARWVAVTGAACPVRVGDRPGTWQAPQFVPAGSVLSIGPARNGLRTYLAVAGGITCPPVLNSRSTDTLSGLGPPLLRPGTELPIGPYRESPSSVDVAPRAHLPSTIRVRLSPGPQHSWFPGNIFHSRYEVTAASNRVGVRISGPPVRSGREAGMQSEGMVLGAVQIPANGQPIIFLTDHPTTGGYPVIGVVDPDDLWMVAQSAPGTGLVFVPSTPSTTLVTISLP